MDSEKLNEQWRAISAQVSSYADMDASQVSAFFSRLEPQAMSDSFLMLTADNDFIKSWVEQHYVEPIQRALRDLTGVQFVVAVAVDPTQEARKAASATAPAPAAGSTATAPAAGAVTTPVMPPAPPATGSAATPVVPPTPAPGQAGTLGRATPLPTSSPMGTAPLSTAPQPYMPPYDEAAVIDHYSPQPAPEAATGGASRPSCSTSSLTFGNFVIGDSNRMAYSMAVEVAESPGRSPLNPLFIYGKSGLGKTHLMRAIQNYIEETRPGMRTVYADSADFLSKHVEAARAHDREKSSYKDFKTYYEEADVLLIDDVQYLQGKTQTLDIVFQLFNTLTAQGKQVVLSADRMPKNIGIDERYYSRFSAGGVIDIQPPEIETKLGIVKSFADEYSRSEGLGNFTLASDIQMYIAENSSSNIRELKSAVTKVIYQMMLFNRADMTVEEVRTLLENHFSGGPSRNLSIEDIQRAVESFFKVSRSDLVGPKRSRSVVYPRQIAIYLCRQLLDLPYNDIGKKFNRDHSTAMHSVASVEEMLKDNRGVQEEIEALQKIISEYSE